MQPEEAQNFRASFNASSKECRKALTEYYELARLPELSEEQAIRLHNILGMAELDETVGFLINEIDELTFQELGFYEEEFQAHFENEVSNIQEFILDGAERRTLLLSAIANQVNPSSARQDIYSNYSYPRLEMLLDTGHAVRTDLQKLVFSDEVLFCSREMGFYLRKHQDRRDRALPWYRPGSILNFLKEESISLLAAASLTLLVCLIIF